MSHLFRVVSDELSAIHAEAHVAIWLNEEVAESPTRTDQEWEHLWTDVGGEG